MFRRFKQILRRRKLSQSGIEVEVQLQTLGMGSRTGVWHVYAKPLGSESIIYSFGVGKNVEWDLGMIQKLGSTIHAFDPTPRSIEWLSEQSLPESFLFYPVGLSDFKGEIEFFVPGKEHKVNYSSVKSSSPDQKTIHCPVDRLECLARQRNHEYIDVLKMDIEGGEMTAIPDILKGPIKIGQILVEFHYMYPSINFEQFTNMVNILRDNGYKIFHISERGYEFSFIHTSIL